MMKSIHDGRPASGKDCQIPPGVVIAGAGGKDTDLNPFPQSSGNIAVYQNVSRIPFIIALWNICKAGKFAGIIAENPLLQKIFRLGSCLGTLG